jgi:SAM-dependent methyltransferase
LINLYSLWYRYGTPPWVGEARPDLVRLVSSGTLSPPGRVLDLGCGTGPNAIYLAQQGFDVTGVDFASAALEKARSSAREAGVEVDFVLDDLTHLSRVKGPFDLLVDYSSFDDLKPKARAAYVRSVVPLTRPGTRFLLWCFEWEPNLRERAVTAILPVGNLTLRPGEVERAFSGSFDVERIASESGLSAWPRGWASYLMTRRAA